MSDVRKGGKTRKLYHTATSKPEDGKRERVADVNAKHRTRSNAGDATVSERNGRIPSPSGVGLHSSSLLVKEGTGKNGIRVRVVCLETRDFVAWGVMMQ